MSARVLVMFVAALWASVALGQVGMPEVVITPVAHVGDPAPGIPGATFDYFLAPQIDAAGNVLFLADLAGPGIDSSNYVSIYYGPPGAAELIAWMSAPAPDMGGGIMMESLIFANHRLSENGWISFTADLAGPGIVEGFNHMAIFAGPPGDIRKVLQGGDQAPGLDPGIIIDVSNDRDIGIALSDNATFRVVAYLAGPGVDTTNNRVHWIGTRDGLQLAWREGMPAPGCEPGVTFTCADSVVFNDAGQIALRGGLEGPGVDDTNRSGYWTGPPGALELVARGGEPAWGCGEGIVHHSWGTDAPLLNTQGDVGYWTLLAEEGAPPDDDMGLWSSTAQGTYLLGRYGDPAPEIGSGVGVASVGACRINLRGEVFYCVKYQGDTIDSSNEWAMYFGPYHVARLSLRDGDPAPHLDPGTVLSAVGGMPGLCAMNDTGDIVSVTKITGPDVTEENQVVLWLRDSVIAHWVPLVRGGALIEGRIVSAPDTGDLGFGYANKTGGSDGQPQSLNDAGQLAIKIEFTDGSHGVYRIEPPVFGDADGDGDVDLADWSSVQLCHAGPGAGLRGGCELFDFDWNGDVDLADFVVFQRLLGDGL